MILPKNYYVGGHCTTMGRCLDNETISKMAREPKMEKLRFAFVVVQSAVHANPARAGSGASFVSASGGHTVAR